MWPSRCTVQKKKVCAGYYKWPKALGVLLIFLLLKALSSLGIWEGKEGEGERWKKRLNYVIGLVTVL